MSDDMPESLPPRNTVVRLMRQAKAALEGPVVWFRGNFQFSFTDILFFHELTKLQKVNIINSNSYFTFNIETVSIETTFLNLFS